MNKVDIQTAKKNISIKTPTCWDELTQQQFLEVVQNLESIADGTIPDALMLVLTGIDKAIYVRLSPVQRHALKKTFAFLHEKPELKKLLVQSFEVDGIRYVGYQPGFSNTTWEEFLFCDQYFMENKFLEGIAVLYREEKPNHDGQSDIRIPFSTYGMPKRIAAFQNLDKTLIAAIVLNYHALRERNITEQYPAIFSYTAAAEETSENNFSWLEVHRNIISEHFYQESMFFRSKVHAVLHRMNTLIEENRKRKK